MIRRIAALLFLLMAFATAATAHEVRPAYLEIHQTAPDRYEVKWHTPVLSGMRLPVVLKLPAGVYEIGTPVIREMAGSRLETRVIETGPDGLVGKRIEFPGLEATITDVLVRVDLLDGTRSTTLVRASQPWVDITGASAPFAVAGAFVKHGIEHILGGYDHLLFVLALFLIVPSRRALLWTITAFTIAHSITLALATLGVVRVPGPPVEAAIALSIVLLAAEILRVRQGQPSLTARWPWAIAFSFGLLHGFGFAGALTQIGLPQSDIPLALFSFNAGVEIGQLMFIAALIAFVEIAKRLPLPRRLLHNALPITSYVIGTLATFWFISRLQGFIA